MPKTEYYCADFETNTTAEAVLENPVWLWCIAEMHSKREEQVEDGASIEDFLQSLVFRCSLDKRDYDDYTVFFHNLKFDGNFIIPELLRQEWRYVDHIDWQYKNREPRTFSVLRSAQGAFYSIKLVINRGRTITFRDSLKIITGTIKSMPKLFGFEGEMEKLPFSEDDYTRVRPYGYSATEMELRYCKHDVLVLCRALQELEKADFDFSCLTTGAYAWKSVCDNLGSSQSSKKNRSSFKSKMFSISEEEWKFARQAYYGGITVVNPKYAGKHLKQVGRTDDVNSMYPTVMRYYRLPFGEGMHIKGCPIDHEYLTPSGRKPRYNEGTVWIAHLRCHMELKPDSVPIFTPKCTYPDNPVKRMWSQGERVVSTRDRSEEPIEVYLTSVDWDNLNLHYDFSEVEWLDAYLYKSRSDLFAYHVDHYTAMKVESKKKHLKGQTYVAKLCLNSAYGKLGQRSYLDNLKPYIADDGTLKWDNEINLHGTIFKEGRPMHMAAFITAWARWILCEHIRAVGYDRFCYADTDSVHYLGTDAPEGTEIDSTKLGAWDNESIWTEGKFIRPKAYYEVFEDGTHNIKLAGCPNHLLEGVSIEDFDIGLTVHGKLRPVIVPRGVILEKTDYTFKEKIGAFER